MEITMKNRQFKVLPIGKDNFAELRDKNRYYVDKTSYLKQVFDIDGSDVLLFTRPRRFGKTLLLDMFKNFLKISEKIQEIPLFRRSSLKTPEFLKTKISVKSTWVSFL